MREEVRGLVGEGSRGKGQRERAYFELVDSSKSVEGRYWQQPLQ